MKRSLLLVGLMLAGSAYAADNQIYIQQTTTGVTNTNIDIGFLNIAQILTIMSVIFGLIIFFKIKTNLFK